MGSRERVNRQTDRDSTAIGRSGRRSRRCRLVDQESGAEEQTGRQGLGGRRDSQTGRDQRTGMIGRDQRTGRIVRDQKTGRIGGGSGFESRESTVKHKRQSGRECLEGED